MDVTIVVLADRAVDRNRWKGAFDAAELATVTASTVEQARRRLAARQPTHLLLDTADDGLAASARRTWPTARPLSAREVPSELAERLRGRPPVLDARRAGPFDLVVVGVSTGGPRVAAEVFPRLPAEFPLPIVVAQHIPPAFSAVYAERLAALCALDAVEVSGCSPLRPGRLHVGRGDHDLVVERIDGQLHARCVPSDPAFSWHPSVERMVRSALEVVPAHRLLGVQLTGMGYDGGEAMARIRRGGGRVVVQDEATSAVYGMPKAVVELDGADRVLPSSAIAAQLAAWVGTDVREA